MSMLSSLEFQNTVAVDLEMPTKPYLMARAETLHTAHQLIIQSEPTVLAEEYRGIPTMPPEDAGPLSICAAATHVSARLTEHKEEPIPQLAVLFSGRHKAALFNSLPSTSDRGRETYFNVNYKDSNDEQQVALEACDNLCLSLDNAVPTPHGSFSELSHPRFMLPFSTIAKSIGTLLLPYARTVALEQSYSCRSFGVSNMANLIPESKEFPATEHSQEINLYEMGYGARLLIRSMATEGCDDEREIVRLSVLAPYETSQGLIMKQIQYNFDPARKHIRTSGKLILMSNDLSVPQLKTQVRKDWPTSGSMKPAKAALEALQEDFLNNFGQTYPTG